MIYCFFLALKASNESLQPLAKIRVCSNGEIEQSVIGAWGQPREVTFGLFTVSQLVDLRPGLNFVHAFHTYTLKD